MDISGEHSLDHFIDVRNMTGDINGFGKAEDSKDVDSVGKEDIETRIHQYGDREDSEREASDQEDQDPEGDDLDDN